jgi:hypothetical protein
MKTSALKVGASKQKAAGNFISGGLLGKNGSGES